MNTGKPPSPCVVSLIESISIPKSYHFACLVGSRSFQEILSYLELQYDHILAEESRIRRNPRFKDQRVHALLYFIPPTGHA